MPEVKHSYTSLAETGTTTLSDGAADADFPLYRVYDRNIGRPFKGSAAVTTTIKVDQGASGTQAIDRLIVPDGHNLSGELCHLQYSDDDSFYVDAARLIASAGQINIDLTDPPELVPNGGFETGDFTGWAAQSATASTDEAYAGIYSAKLDVTGAAITGPLLDDLWIDVLEVYTVQYRYNVTAISAGFWNFRVRYVQSNGTLISQNVRPNVSAATAGWIHDSFTIGPSGSGADFSYPALTAGIELQVQTGGTPTLTAYLDDVSVKLTTAPTGHTKRYWKFSVLSPSAAPEIAELFLTDTYTWARQPARPAGSLDDIINVQREGTVSGQDRFIQHGPTKMQRRYELRHIGESQKTEMVSLWESFGGGKPFYLKDHTGNWTLVRIASQPDIREKVHQGYDATFEFIEVLP